MTRFILMLALFLCVSPALSHAASHEEQRAEIQRMQSSVLGKLYRIHPGAVKDLAGAAGYAVFSSADVAAIFFSGSVGHGIAHENQTGRETYMEMASAGIGLGLGVKDFRTVFIFDNPRVFHDFISTGLDLSGNVDLAIKQGTNGGAASGAADVLPGVRVYQFTDTGLLAQAMLKGTKYWRDGDLNDVDRSGNRAESSYNDNDR